VRTENGNQRNAATNKKSLALIFGKISATCKGELNIWILKTEARLWIEAISKLMYCVQ